VIFKAIISVFSSRLLGAAAYFIINMLMLYEYSKIDYAEFFFYFSLVPLLVFCMNLGLNKSFLISSKLNKVEVSHFLYIKGMIIIPFIFLSIVSVFFEDTLFSYAFVNAILLAVIECALIIFQSTRDYRKFSIYASSRNILWLTLVIIMYFYSMHKEVSLSVEQVFVGLTLSSLCVALFSIFSFKSNIRYVPIEKLINNLIWKKGRKYFWVDLSAALLVRLEIWIFGGYIYYSLVNKADLANYSAAFSLAFAIPLITNSIYSIILPEFVGKKESCEKMIFTMKKNWGYAFSLTLVIALSGHFLVLLLLPSNYAEAATPFSIIVIGVSFTFFNNILQVPLINAGEDSLVKYNSIIQFLSATFFGLFFIFEYGAIGAALSLALSRLVGFILTIRNINKLKG
jgi:O-antigen/teichoic acid export membrane protein